VLLLFGWTTRTKTLGTASFYCQNERGDHNYVLLEARRWFTLFFIPVIPLKVLGALVQCSSCGVQYDSGVLEQAAPPLASNEGEVTSDELEAIVRVGTELGMLPARLRTILVEKIPADVVDEAIRRI